MFPQPCPAAPGGTPADPGDSWPRIADVQLQPPTLRAGSPASDKCPCVAASPAQQDHSWDWAPGGSVRGYSPCPPWETLCRLCCRPPCSSGPPPPPPPPPVVSKSLKKYNKNLVLLVFNRGSRHLFTSQPTDRSTAASFTHPLLSSCCGQVEQVRFGSDYGVSEVHRALLFTHYYIKSLFWLSFILIFLGHTNT